MTRETYEEEKARIKLENAKLREALALLDIKAEEPKEEDGNTKFDCIRANLGAHQTIFCRIDSYKHKGKFNISTHYEKSLYNISLYDFKSVEINIAKTKTAEQIAKDIKKRILEAPEFIENYQYIEKRIKQTEERDNAIETHKKLFGQAGVVFSDDRDKDTANKWIRTDSGHLRIHVEVSPTLDYCSMTLQGLSIEQWEKVIEVVGPMFSAPEEI